MASRKENFYAYYKANPDKLKGKTVDEAYAAMRRNVQATKGRAGKTDAGKLTGAVERRLAKATENSRKNTLPKYAKGDEGFRTLRQNASGKKRTSLVQDFVNQARSGKNSKGQTLADQFRQDIGRGKDKKKPPQFNAAIERRLIKYAQSRKP